MKYGRVPFNTTKQIPEKGNIISGRKDAIFLRNKYQTELDNAHASIVNMVHRIEESNARLKEQYNYAQSVKRNIEAHEEERNSLYETLENLLKRETDFESKMWKDTQKGRKVKSVTIKQKFNESDIDEMKYDSMLEYLKQYPEYASKASFRKIIDKIEEKEREIRREKQQYNQSVSKYNYFLSLFEKDIQKSEDKFAAYDKILSEAKKKIGETRYIKSVFYKFASEKTKAEVNVDMLHHRVEQFKNTLNIIKSELSENKRRKFVEMNY